MYPLFNKISCSKFFDKQWIHSDYYKDLLNPYKSNAYFTIQYDTPLYFNTNPDSLTLRHYNNVLLYISIYYGDLIMTKKLLKHNINNINNINILLSGLAIKSENFNIIKLIDDKCKIDWTHALIKSIDINNTELIKYCSSRCGFLNRHRGFIHCLRLQKIEWAKYLLDEGIDLMEVISKYPKWGNNELIIAELNKKIID
jgi:hypothetical protein